MEITVEVCVSERARVFGTFSTRLSVVRVYSWKEMEMSEAYYYLLYWQLL